MKSINPAMLAHLASEVTTLATILKLTRADGVVMGFTDHDRDITVGGVTYEAAIGCTRSALSTKSDLSVDNLQVAGVIDSAGIRDVDVRAGVYDYARIEIALVNWADPSMGVIRLPGWRLGQVQISDHGFTAEIMGIAQAFARQIIRVYTPDCDADLGDARCGVNLTAHTETGTVVAVASATRQFTATISGGRPAGFFDGGLLTWTAGANLGHPPLEVKSEAAGQVTLFLPTSFPIVVDDTFSISAGCDKAASTCQAKFANIANFRGFPFVPGLDAAVQTPNAL
jgi:uncharacterized phage protein (TIGR02218 family)